ncbi:MAG: glycosyltransferase, partial [Candidatus Tectomicrobia bacterium]|nr:glycosyltransferase [Candidatus Tectomicrobia bacterium]
MYCGGQGIYLYYLSKALAEAGHQVTVVVSPPYPGPMPWAKVYKINNENFYARGYPHFLPKDSPLEIFRPLNFFEFVSTRLKMFPEMLSFSLRAFSLLQGIKRKERFDIIHDNQCLGYGLLLMRRLGAPVVATIHHPLAIDRTAALEQARSFSERLKRLMYYPWVMQKLVSQRLDGIITVSN